MLVKKPTYDELANAFAEYVSATSNDGAVPFGLDHGDKPSKEEVKQWEDEIERASSVVGAAGGKY